MWRSVLLVAVAAGCVASPDLETESSVAALAGDECYDTSASVTVCGGDLMCICADPLSVTGPHPPDTVCPEGCFPTVVDPSGDAACAFAEGAGQSLSPPICPKLGNSRCIDMGIDTSRAPTPPNCCTYDRTRRCGPYTYEDMIGFQLKELGIIL